jgi:hypothetical protein
MSSAVNDTAGGQLLREDNGALSSRTIANAFSDYNGLGRRVRVRYDSPAFNGFTIRASYGQDQLNQNPNVQDDPQYDIVLNYANDLGDFRLDARLGYTWVDAKATDVTTNIFGGSASILHSPTGLNFTVASADRSNEIVSQNYWYVKGGWIGDLVAWGKTAVAIDYYDGANILNQGSTSTSTGFSVVQNVTNWNTEFWATYRTYDVDSTAVAYESSDALFFGARFRF